MISRINTNDMDVSEGCVNPFRVELMDKKYDFPLQLTFGCHRRFDCICPVCAKKWRNKNFDRFRKGISGMIRPRFLTLTLKYDKELGESDRVKQLWSYRKYFFKQLKRWGYRITKWIAVIEFPAHMHIVYDGDYLPHDKLVDLWKHITEDSMMVDIRAVGFGRSSKQMAGYLSKYMNKIRNCSYADLEKYKQFKLVWTYNLQLDKCKMIIQYYEMEDIGIDGWKRISNYEFYYLCKEFQLNRQTNI